LGSFFVDLTASNIIQASRAVSITGFIILTGKNVAMIVLHLRGGFTALLLFFECLATVNCIKGWCVGRIPPSRFEYKKLNGFYTSLQAKKLCENDIQCGGFTFKGAKHGVDKKEIYFFHFVADDQISLNEYLKYPHWSTYIVSSRDFVAIRGSYASELTSSSLLRTKHM